LRPTRRLTQNVNREIELISRSCHFPIAYQQEFFNQLTSEEVRTRFVHGHPVRYWFKPSGKRNEPLDRRVYALAALNARPVPWEVLLRAAPIEPPLRPPSLLEGSCVRRLLRWAYTN
jgi:phage terminase large subunit GpA-like protein